MASYILLRDDKIDDLLIALVANFLFLAKWVILSAQRDAGPNIDGQWVYEESIMVLVPGYL